MKYPVMQPWTVETPEKMQRADMIEIRVAIIPLRYSDDNPKSARYREEMFASKDQLHGAVCYSRIQGYDSRAVFHLLRQLLQQMVYHWLGVEI